MQDATHLSHPSRFEDAFDGLLDMQFDDATATDRSIDNAYCNTVLAPNSVILIAGGMVAALTIGVLLALSI